MTKTIPLLKEYRLEKLIKCLNCFDLYAYNRDKQRECVIEEYDISKQNDIKHWDKSVFRGMVIPSLKYLEFIYGEKDEYLVSANGKLLLEAKRNYESLFNTVLKAVIKDIDEQKFFFLDKLTLNFQDRDKLIRAVDLTLGIEKEKSKIERINKWLNILEQAKLIEIKKREVRKLSLEFQDLELLNAEDVNVESFIQTLFKSYDKLAIKSAGIVKIENLRSEAIVDFLTSKKLILISSIFDKILRKIPLNSKSYAISLGKPMRAKESLYFFNGNYYDTILINFHGK